MQYVVDAFDDPRDEMAFRCVFPSLRERGEAFVDMARTEGQLMVMRYTTWTSLTLFNPQLASIPWFGQHLRELDIRCDGSVDLFFTEFLPELTDLRITTLGVSGGIRSPVHKLKHLKIITAGLFGLFSNTAEMLPELQSLEIRTTILHGASGLRFPPKLESLYISGLLMFHVVDALPSCPAKDVSLVCGGLLDVPLLNTNVERLDLSNNLLESFGSDRFPRLRELNVHNNFLFDCTTILGDAIEVLDIRGTAGWPFHLRNVHTVYTNCDPPAHMKVSCPKLKYVYIRDVDRYLHTWNAHALLMEPDDDWTERVRPDWRSHIDDVDILYQLDTTYPATINGNT